MQLSLPQFGDNYVGEKMSEKKDEEKNPEQIMEQFVNWLKADWSHIALVILAILFVIVLIALIVRRR